MLGAVRDATDSRYWRVSTDEVDLVVRVTYERGLALVEELVSIIAVESAETAVGEQAEVRGASCAAQWRGVSDRCRG